MTCFVWRKDRDLVSTASIGHIADRIRPTESSFHIWDRPTKTPFSYDTGAYLLEIEGLFTQGWLPGRVVQSATGLDISPDPAGSAPDVKLPDRLRVAAPAAPPCPFGVWGKSCLVEEKKESKNVIKQVPQTNLAGIEPVASRSWKERL
jgi:hypothetical protein